MSRIVVPTEDEFESWRLHPVTQFVASAYERLANEQRLEWGRHFDAAIDPIKLAAVRLELKTREDAYRAFLETTFERFLAVVDPQAGTRPAVQPNQAVPNRLRRAS
jgi:hypothetical protein